MIDQVNVPFQDADKSHPTLLEVHCRVSQGSSVAFELDSQLEETVNTYRRSRARRLQKEEFVHTMIRIVFDSIHLSLTLPEPSSVLLVSLPKDRTSDLLLLLIAGSHGVQPVSNVGSNVFQTLTSVERLKSADKFRSGDNSRSPVSLAIRHNNLTVVLPHRGIEQSP